MCVSRVPRKIRNRIQTIQAFYDGEPRDGTLLNPDPRHRIRNKKLWIREDAAYYLGGGMKPKHSPNPDGLATKGSVMGTEHTNKWRIEQVPTCEVENRPGHNTLSDVVTNLKVRRQNSLKKNKS